MFNIAWTRAIVQKFSTAPQLQKRMEQKTVSAGGMSLLTVCDIVLWFRLFCTSALYFTVGVCISSAGIANFITSEASDCDCGTYAPVLHRRQPLRWPQNQQGKYQLDQMPCRENYFLNSQATAVSCCAQAWHLCLIWLAIADFGLWWHRGGSGRGRWEFRRGFFWRGGHTPGHERRWLFWRWRRCAVTGSVHS